jgi:hypothetical protein
MANKAPIKAIFTNGDATALGQFESGDTIPIANGGTGSIDTTSAKVNLSVISAADGSLIVPSGNTGARDASPAAGLIRFNSDLSAFEGYNGSAWVQLTDSADTVDADTLQGNNAEFFTTQAISFAVALG